MSLLLDTRVLLWWLAGSERLPAALIERIDGGRETVYVSAASVFEIELKRSTGKLICPDNLQGEIEAAGFKPLPITMEHAMAAGRLPAHHTDPFDRLLTAQTQCDGLTLVTSEGQFQAYGVDLLLI